MKKLVLIFAIIISGVFQSKAATSNLQLVNQNNAPIKVVMDGQIVSQNSFSPVISGIPEGNRYVEIFQTIQQGNNIFENKIYEGNLYIPGNVQIIATVTNGQLVYNNLQALQTQQTNYYNNVQVPQYNTKPIFFPINSTVQTLQQPIVCNTTNSVHQFGPQAMHPQDFNLLKNTINQRAFSNGKMAVVNQALNNNYFTSQQVFELVNLMTFDSDKLNIAKQSYASTIDIQNYFLVYQALDFNSSINNLSAYIASL